MDMDLLLNMKKYTCIFYLAYQHKLRSRFQHQQTYFSKGAIEAGNEVEKIFVAGKNIGYCKACYACKDTGICAIKDDMAEVLQKMLDADVIVLSKSSWFSM